jgi:hypothetical protein
VGLSLAATVSCSAILDFDSLSGAEDGGLDLPQQDGATDSGDQGRPDRSTTDLVPDRARSDLAKPDRSVKDHAVLDKTVADKTVPDKPSTVPDKALADLGAPDQPVVQPDQALPDVATGDQSVDQLIDVGTDSAADACLLGKEGDPCTADSDCCSNKCLGPTGSKTCKAAT